MWKLLRNAVLAIVLLAGALKLLVWYEVGQDGARLTALLAPYAELHYNSLGADLNGNVDLGGVVITIPNGRGHDVYRAEQIGIETPGVFWLLRRALTSDNSLPAHLAFNIRGLQSKATNSYPLFDASWISPLSLVPFETQGCGVVSRFSIADYQRMGLNPGEARQRVEYRYDSGAATLDFNAALVTPPFSTITLRGELQQFDPKASSFSNDMRKLHFGQLGLDYADDNYLAKRNRFCAQMSNIAPTQFVDQHVTAVASFLTQRGVVPDANLLQMYRRLVDSGGHLGLLSLPSATFDSSQLLVDSPEEVLRQLNVTTRYNDEPPVMFRLAFNPGNAVARSDTMTVFADTAHEAALEKPVAANADANAARAPTTPVPPPATTETKLKPLASTNADAQKAPTAPIANQRVAPSVVPPVKSAAAVSPPPATAAGVDTAGLQLSAPSPPPDSTLALVWKATIERLPEQAKKPRDHDVIDFAALDANIGARVRLLTMGGNKVEGRVIAVDNTSVRLRLSNTDGTAELQMPRTAIREIQILRNRVGVPAAD